MFGLIMKYRKEIQAAAAVISFTVAKLVSLAKEVVVFASEQFAETTWAFSGVKF